MFRFRISHSAFLLIGMLALSLAASFAAINTAHATNYTFSQGYYWYAGQAYNRAWVAYYDHYGCKRYGWRYTAVKTITSKTPNWRSELLQLKAARDKWYANIEASANEQNEFIETVRELGLNGSYSGAGIGVATIDRSNPYAIQGGHGGYSQLSAVQGTAHWGYSPLQFSVADTYGNIDIGAMYNASMRLAENANGYGGKATANAMALVDKLGDRSASLMAQAMAVKEIEAKTAGIVQVSQALSQSIRAEARAYVAHGQANGGQSGNGQAGPDAATQAAIQNGTLSNIADVMTFRCATCHKPGGKGEQFDLTNLEAITDQQAGNILSRVTSSDPAKRMPPDKPLSVEELRVVFAAASAAGGQGESGQGDEQQSARED